MIPTNLGDVEEGRELTEQELQALYLYLDMYMDSMDEEQKMFWLEVLTRVDKKFYDDTSDGADDVQALQGAEGSA